MKNLKKSITKLLIVLPLFIFALAAQPAQAQILPFDDDIDDQTPAAPIDGFIGLALAAGAYFGIRKIVKKGQ
jgi:hypothetical protein